MNKFTNGQYYNRRINPITGENEPKRIISDNINYFSITVPAKNIPDFAPTRIECDLPEIPDITKPYRFFLKNPDSSTTSLTQVLTLADLIESNNSYCLANQSLTDGRPTAICFSENLIGKIIYYDYYGLGSVLCANNIVDLIVKNLEAKTKIVSSEIETTSFVSLGLFSSFIAAQNLQAAFLTASVYNTEYFENSYVKHFKGFSEYWNIFFQRNFDGAWTSDPRTIVIQFGSPTKKFTQISSLHLTVEAWYPDNQSLYAKLNLHYNYRITAIATNNQIEINIYPALMLDPDPVYKIWDDETEDYIQDPNTPRIPTPDNPPWIAINCFMIAK